MWEDDEFVVVVCLILVSAIISSLSRGLSLSLLFVTVISVAFIITITTTMGVTF